MLVVVIQPLGVVEDEVAVDQVIEHERPPLHLALLLGLVLDLDVVVVALVDPGELILGGRGIADGSRTPQSWPIGRERSAIDRRDDARDLVDPGRGEEGDDAEPQRDPGPDGVEEFAEEGRAQGQHGAQHQHDALGPEVVDQDEPGQERAEDAADHPPGIDLPDCAARPVNAAESLHRELGDDRTDRPHGERGEEKHAGHDQEDSERPGQRDLGAGKCVCAGP